MTSAEIGVAASVRRRRNSQDVSPQPCVERGKRVSVWRVCRKDCAMPRRETRYSAVDLPQWNRYANPAWFIRYVDLMYSDGLPPWLVPLAPACTTCIHAYSTYIYSILPHAAKVAGTANRLCSIVRYDMGASMPVPVRIHAARATMNRNARSRWRRIASCLTHIMTFTRACSFPAL